MGDSAYDKAAELLQQAGISINGPHAWDIQVKEPAFYSRVMAGGSLALGESYMDGWWDAEALDEFMARLLEARLEERATRDLRTLFTVLKYRIANPQTPRRAYRIGERHYDIGNDLFRIMLDSRMVYSCGYWRNAETLDEAQEAKLDLICRKLDLKPGMTLLDIGCGWGSLLKYAAEHYGVEGTGVTVSRQQAELARSVCGDLPVRIELDDYRGIRGTYDRIASVGMVEHVGWRNYGEFMRTSDRLLKPGGLFLLHSIGSSRSNRGADPWIERYIFPNSMLPSLAQLAAAAEPHFVAEDVHNFGPYYDRTLMEWERRFREGWNAISDRYGDRFFRMWRYYLLSSAASFRVRRIQLYQILYSKRPRPEPVRREY